MTRHYGTSPGDGVLPGSGRTGIGKNERVKGIDEGPDCPIRAAFIRELLGKYSLRERTVTTTVTEPVRVATKRQHAINPTIPLRERPVSVHINGTPELVCKYCGKKVERTGVEQETCGGDRCKGKRNQERKRERAAKIVVDPAELLRIAREKGAIR